MTEITRLHVPQLSASVSTWYVGARPTKAEKRVGESRVALKCCPTCRRWKPTRGTHVVCAQCRHVARMRAQISHLDTAQRRTFFTKLIRNGMSRKDAMHEAMKVAP